MLQSLLHGRNVCVNLLLQNFSHFLNTGSFQVFVKRGKSFINVLCHANADRLGILDDGLIQIGDFGLDVFGLCSECGHWMWDQIAFDRLPECNILVAPGC